MKEYKALEILHIGHGGKLGLNKEQATPRMHLLDKIEGEPGNYKVKAGKIICLKVGEIFGYEGKMDRVLESKVRDMNEPEDPEEPEDMDEDIAPEDAEGFPKHLGAGHYEMPDGTRIRGKEKAEQYFEEHFGAE